MLRRTMYATEGSTLPLTLEGSTPGHVDRAPGRPALTPVRLTLGRWCKNVKLWLLFAGAVGLIVLPYPYPYPYQA